MGSPAAAATAQQRRRPRPLLELRRHLVNLYGGAMDHASVTRGRFCPQKVIDLLLVDLLCLTLVSRAYSSE